MAFTASTIWDVQASGNAANGGGFDTGVSGFATDGAATLATSIAPVFTSASYTFVAGDVGHWVYIKSGTNWIPGWYQIASVSAGAATLTASIGSATNSFFGVTGAAGCATTASPTGATWGLDYSKGASAKIAFTDMVIDGTTNTKFTSAAGPVGKNFVGNIINITSGTGFTVQRVAIVSTSGTTATCDKSLGTLSSTGGNGNLGGALATLSATFALMVGGNTVWAKGTFTLTTMASAPGAAFQWYGWGTTRGDTSRATVTTSTNSTTLISLASGAGSALIRNIAFANTATTRSYGVRNDSITMQARFENCTFSGFTYAIHASTLVGWNTVTLALIHCSITGSLNSAIFAANYIQITDCFIGSSTGEQIVIASAAQLVMENTIMADGASAGVWSGASLVGTIKNCTFSGNNGGAYGNIYTAAGIPEGLLVENTVIYGGNHGINSGVIGLIGSRYNAIGNVSIAAYTNTGAGPGFVTLSADPFTNSASGDYSLNSTSGGGAACKSAGAPGTFVNGTTASAPDIGAAQGAASGGSGGGAALSAFAY